MDPEELIDPRPNDDAACSLAQQDRAKRASRRSGCDAHRVWGSTREAAIRPNKMALHSAEFPFLLPALAVPWQNCCQMSVPMVQCDQK